MRRRDTIPPPSGMRPTAGRSRTDENGFGRLEETGSGDLITLVDVNPRSWARHLSEGTPLVPRLAGQAANDTAEVHACPMCGVDLSTWTLPDLEAHGDACLLLTFGEEAEGRRNDTVVTDETRPSEGRRGAEGRSRDEDGGVDGAPRRVRRAPPGTDNASPTRWIPPPDAMDPLLPSDCGAWLASVGLFRFAPAFAREELTMEDAKTLTEEELRDVLGVESAADIRTLMASIAALKATTVERLAPGPAGHCDRGGECLASRCGGRGIAGGAGARWTDDGENDSRRPSERLGRGMSNRRRKRRCRRAWEGCGDADVELTRGERAREDAEAHDDEWLRLAMAMSASMEDTPNVVITTAGDFGWIPMRDTDTPAPRAATADHISGPSPPDEASSLMLAGVAGAAEPIVGLRAPLGDRTNAGAVDARIASKSAEVPSAAHQAKDQSRDESRKERDRVGVMAMARRSAGASLWKAAGHGGKDAPLPPSVLSRFMRPSAP